MREVTRILKQIENGDPTATDQLLPLVYDELRKLARHKLTLEKPGQTLQGTALVHEAYARLVDSNNPVAWENRNHFFAAAAEAMRRILVEQARRKLTKKRGADQRRVPLMDLDASDSDEQQIIEIHDVLDKLAAQDAEAGELVKLRFFAGFSMVQSAEVMRISERKAHYLWSYARSWLRAELS